MWIPNNADLIPEDIAPTHNSPERVHVDVARKRDIWEACCHHLNKLRQEEPGVWSKGKNPVSIG
jgi:hypothetical protein